MSVGVAPVTKADDLDQELVVEDLIDDPVVADAHPIRASFALQLYASWRAGIVSQQIQRSANSLLFAAWESAEPLRCPARDLDAVGTHSRPRSALTSSHGT